MVNNTDAVMLDTSGYVRYIPGGEKSNLIISVPHGGTMRPASIMSRNKHPLSRDMGGEHRVTCVMDSGTKELALLLQEALSRELPAEEAPHVIIAEIHREKVDLNRGIEEATLNVQAAVDIFHEYHRCIKVAANSVKRGLFIDIHGQSHPEKWVELGYMIKKTDVNTDMIKPELSSVHHLAKNCRTSIRDLICGDVSLGRFLDEEGVKTVPSPSHPVINGHYFHGGYNTGRYGSMKKGEIDAIQIESPNHLRRSENVENYAHALARSLRKFINLHYKVTGIST